MKNLIYLRKTAGKTQKEMAEIAGVSPQVYCHYENNRVTPPLDSLKRLADFFDVSIDYIVDRESEDGLIVSEGQSLSGDEKELLNGFRRLNAAGKGRILGNLEGLLQASALFTDKTAK